MAEATQGDGVWVVDDTGLPTQGRAAVGVARQDSGTLGQVGNCQVAVTCGYSDPQVTWVVAVRLYLPKIWADDSERRQQVREPPAVTLQTEPEIALALLDQARAWGVPHRCIVAVRTDFQVSVGQAAISPVWRADELVQTAPRSQWRTIRWRRGTKLSRAD